MTDAAAPHPGRSFSLTLPGCVKWHHVLLVAIILLASFSRIWRLDVPSRCYFDEVYFPTTGAEILRGDNDAWQFYGHENTHPPLSKVLMAAGMGIFGHRDYQGGTNECWPDTEDSPKKNSDDWLYDPFGWRFPGAVAGIGAVIFMYLLAKRLLDSEVAALSAAFLLTIDGLAFTQARIATPDTYVLFFTLGAVYFMVSHRWALAGIFLGASAASKWIGAFTIAPIIFYYAWTAIVRWKEAGSDARLREAERVLTVGGGAALTGLVITALFFVADGLSRTALLAGGVPFAVGAFVIAGGLIAIATDPVLRTIPRAQVYMRTAVAFPIYFIAIPFAVYMATSIPMFLNGHDTAHWWDLNRSAYEFHSSLDATHPYQASLWGWPIDQRPVFLYLGQGYTKIYNLGNPLIFWMSIPALVFTLWQSLRLVRARLDSSGRIAVWGSFGQPQAMLLFIVLSYLAFWLSLSTQGRALFLYHYLEALAFAILALGYVIHWLWYHPWKYSRFGAILFLVMASATAMYFYPHWAAVDLKPWFDETYYWFDSWR